VDADDLRTRLVAGLSVANADRIAMFVSPLTEGFVIGRVRKAIGDTPALSAQDRVGRYGGIALMALLQALEVIEDSERFRLPPAEWVILDGVAENARLLAEEGTDGIVTLEQRLATTMGHVEHPPTSDR
jgi:hypothetical protein